jgi:sensor domain CHASE-containing protein/GAF domain-containing protein
MNLQRRSLFILAILTIILTTLSALVLQNFLRRSYLQLEEQATTQNIQRVADAINESVATLRTTSADWGSRDSMYAFVAGEDPAFPEEELLAETLSAVNLNFVLIYDTEDQIFFQRSVNYLMANDMAMPTGLIESITPGSRLLQHPSALHSWDGIVLLPSGPVLVSSRPILTSTGTGPSHGTIIMGRLLDATETRRLSNLTHLSFVVIRLDQQNISEDFQIALTVLNSEISTTYVQPLSNERIAGYTILNDVFDQPALLLRVDSTRDIYAQGQTNINSILISTSAAGLAFGLAAWLLIGSLVVRPVARLNREIQKIGISSATSNRLEVRSEDEIGSLSVSLNQMLENIENSQKEVQRSLVQIRTAADLSRTISSILDPDELLPSVVQFVKDRFNLYYVGIFLVDQRREYALLRAGTGEAGENMLAASHRLRVDNASMIGWSCNNRQSRIALDVGQEAVRFQNPLLPQTRSELAIPILSHGTILGAMSLQSDQVNAFNDNDILILQGVADSLSIAIENTRLFRTTEQSLEEIKALNQAYLQTAWGEVVRSRGKITISYENPDRPGKQKHVQTKDFPISLRDQIIGQIQLETDAKELTQDEKDMVEAIITQTALALENARLLDETQRKAAQEERINKLSVEFSRRASVEEILKTAVREIGSLPGVSEASVHLVRPNGRNKDLESGGEA